MKRFTVYTYFHPADGYHSKPLFLAYLREQTAGAIKYEIEAPNGYEAKKLAIRRRKQREHMRSGV